MSDPGAASLRGAVDLTSLVRRANAPAAPGDDDPDAAVFAVDDLSFGRVVELSRTVPVIVEFGDGRTPGSIVESILATYGGRFALARVDALASPQLVQAFQVQQVPLIAAVIGGRPLPLFVGALPEPEIRDVLEQVLQVAAQQGVTGTVGTGEDAEGAEPAPAPLPPLHQAAYDAIEAGDYAAAIAAYEQAIKENPRDAEAVAGLAQVRLLARLGDSGADADEADRAFASGDAEGAFALLFAAFAEGDASDREQIKTRLLEYFEILGDDPRVGPARRKLTSLLY
ncbi:MAG: tetratricopeptide repeat protein [Microbacteriaceae bacterium]|nr:tetratricopeptide repeat protein [Microbacteriaceae bacterium]